MENTIPDYRCFRCGEPGHVAADCPELRPAATQAEHRARIARYIARFTSGKWTAREKQLAISNENRMWYGDKCNPSLTL